MMGDWLWRVNDFGVKFEFDGQDSRRRAERPREAAVAAKSAPHTAQLRSTWPLSIKLNQSTRAGKSPKPWDATLIEWHRGKEQSWWCLFHLFCSLLEGETVRSWLRNRAGPFRTN
jgi:hypothetical protein